MAATLLECSKQDGQTTTANVNAYFPIGGRCVQSSTETQYQITLREAGTITDLFVLLTANTVNATSTVRTRKNAANGGCTASITANGTGIFEDTSGSDTIAAGDEVCFQWVPGAATGTATFNAVGANYNATTDTVTRLASVFSTTYATASTTAYLQPSGEMSTNTNDNKARIRNTCTAKSLFVNITSNARTTATTIFLRKNGANGTNTISIGSTVSGLLEDTTHSDSFAAGDDLNYSLTTGTGTQNLVITAIAISIITTSNDGFCTGGRSSGMTINANLTNFFHIMGFMNAGNTTEAQVQRTVREAFGFFGLTCVLTSNSVSAASTLTLRKNGADTALVTSITASTTGAFWNSVDSITSAAGDELNYELVTGATGTSMSIRQMACWSNLAGVTRVEKANTFKYHIIGRVSEQNTFKYHILGRTSKQNTLKYHIRSLVSKPNTLRYNILGRVQKPNTLRYNIIGRVLKPNTFKYNIKAKVSKTNTFLYNIRLRVSKPNTLRYNILQRISKPNTLRYNIIGRVRKANTFLYKIVGRVSKPNTLRYNILGRVSDTTTFRYNILGRTSKATSYLYNVRGRVSKLSTFRYNIFVQVKKLNTFKYNILTRISKPNTFIYNIIAALSRVSKPTTYKYNILARTAKPTTYRYNVLQQAQKPTTYRYNILSKTSKPNTFKYNILQRVSKPNTFIYNLIAALARVQKINTFKYNIIARTQKPTTYRYNILQRVSKPNTLRYNILFRIQKVNTYRYNIRSLVQKATTYRYNIVGRVSKTVSFLYNILAEEAVGGAGHFAGGGGISQKLKKTYRPRQETVPPRRIIAIVYVKSRREFAIAVLYTKTRFAVQVKRNFMPLKVAFAPLPVKETPIPKPRVFYTKSTGTLKAASLITKTRGTFRIERLSTRYYLDQEAKFGMLRKLMKIYDMFRSL